MTDICEVCGESEAKYKCPRCLKKSCSLPCSKAHKAQSGCDGKIHDPTKYIPNQSIKGADDEKHESNILVQRDYNFLTSLKRTVELKRRDGKSKNKRTLQDVSSNNAVQNGKRGRYSGEGCSRIIRRGVNCLAVPRGMQRSMTNKSKWDKPLDLFVWTIEWILFPPKLEANMEKFSHISHRIKETDSLAESMGKVIYDKCCEFYKLDSGSDETKLARTQSLLKSELIFYCKWFPYNTMQQIDSKKLVRLDPSKSIAELFRNKTVIEFPTIFVAKSDTDLSNEYSIINEHEIDATKSDSRPPETFGMANGTDSDSDSLPQEESSKPNVQEKNPPQHTPVVTTATATVNSDEDDSDSDGYDPGVTMDFLAH